MPELPEVEIQLLYLERTALGQVIERVTVSEPRLIKSPRPVAFARQLRGRRMVAARRRGKYLIVTLDNGRALILHFGMGGDLKYYRDSSERPRFTRIEFRLANGYRLAFTCPRNICRVLLVGHPSELPALGKMGPEPLQREFSLSHLRGLVNKSPSRRVKVLLMDQNNVAGVGNIYADQILFGAGVRPDRPASTLSEAEIKLVHTHTRRVLARAIRTADEEDFPADFLVSRKEKRAGCPRCGSVLERKKVGGRTTHSCPSCQK